MLDAVFVRTVNACNVFVDRLPPFILGKCTGCYAWIDEEEPHARKLCKAFPACGFVVVRLGSVSLATYMALGFNC